jgi:hypothetical protein
MHTDRLRESPRGKWELIRFPVIPDPRGNLTFIEERRHVPIDIARVFYLYDVPPGSERGGHAHHRLFQLLIAAAGSLQIHLDNGFDRETVTLDRPDFGLLMGPRVWQTMDHFTAGAVCLVLASMPFDEADYIRDYNAFKKLVAKDASSIR